MAGITDILKPQIDAAFAAKDFSKVNQLVQDNRITAGDVNKTYAGFDTKVLADLGIDLVAPYTQYSNQDMTNYFQDFATKNTQGAYTPDAYNVSQQLKDELQRTNADPTQVASFLNSGVTVPVYGGVKAGGTDVNLQDYANEFAMATSKNPMVDANNRLTLDPRLAAQAAQNELDALFNSNTGSMIPIKNSDFEYGGRLYGQIGNRDKLISDYYNNPENQKAITDAQNAVFNKYGVPQNMRFAPRAIAENLAREADRQRPRTSVDQFDFENFQDFSTAQNAASLKDFQNKIETYKKFGVDLMSQNKTANVPSPAEIALANLRAGISSRDPQAEANFYGMTRENYGNAMSGDATRPMGQFQSIYESQKLSPIEQIAAQTARAAGLGNPDPKIVALARKYPEVFSRASDKWAKYLAKNFPTKKASGGPIEYMPNNYRAGGRVKLI